MVMLNGNNTWPVKEGDLIRLKKNDVSRVRWMCQRIGFRMELSNRQQLNTIRACVEDRMEEGCWPNKCQKFDVAASAAKRQPRKTSSG